MISTSLISVPPKTYGGTELIVNLLTEELVGRGHDVTLYSTGDSRTSARLKSIYEKTEWPPQKGKSTYFREIDHLSWAVQDALQSGAEIIRSMGILTHVSIFFFLTLSSAREARQIIKSGKIPS